MIVQALVEYYDRLAADPESGVAPIGWVDKSIGWVVRLDAEGRAKALEPTYEQEGKKRVAKTFRVPEGEHKQGINPRLLWDNAEYVFGIAKEGAKNPEKAAEKAKAFRERIATLGLETLKPVETFLANNPAEVLQALNGETWRALLEDAGALITFRLAGDITPVCDREDVKAAYERVRLGGLVNETCPGAETSLSVIEGQPQRDRPSASACLGAKDAEAQKGLRRCLVSGRRGPVTQTSTAVPIRNGISTGCRLIAFQKGSGFDSYGKEQGNNAPISEEVTFKYTTALKRLLAKGSTNQVAVGDETLLFWASANGVALEDDLLTLLNPSLDDPDRGTRSLQALYRSVEAGKHSVDDDKTRFYFLGLQPNAARLAVRLWIVQRASEAARHLADYFGDLRIVGQKEGEPIPLYLILRNLAPLGKIDNLSPRLGGELLFAAIKGTRFPDSLAQSVLRRLKVEGITTIRAALLKAWLMRIDSTERKPTIMLDTENNNPGYCLGRLFAVLERAQALALGDLNATITDRFYATASADPAAVFATLLRNNIHHEGKLSDAQRIWLGRLKQEICGHLADIPAHLELADQARFALGYYHQRQAFFTKKESPAASETTATQE